MYVNFVIKQNTILITKPNITLPIILIKNFAIPNPIISPIVFPSLISVSKPAKTLNNTIDIPSLILDSPNAI